MIGWEELTFHIARHTFTTSVTLKNGVSNESVGKIQGHKKIKNYSTVRYSLDRKVIKYMKILKEKFGSINHKIKST